MSWLVQGKGLSAALVVDALFQRGVEPHSIYQKGDLAAPAGSLAPAALLKRRRKHKRKYKNAGQVISNI